jgi:monofunctional biosynthetic peptidoglycan transglycosylase
MKRKAARPRALFVTSLRVAWLTIKGIFLAYAVVFSVACTVALAWGAVVVSKPILAVNKLKDVNPRTTLYMDMQRRQLRGDSLHDTLMHVFTPLDSIADHVIEAVLAAEDDGFYLHPGVDLQAIARAIEYNKRKNRHAHGASTITQQVAKNLFAGGERSFERKYAELLYSFLMEFLLGKDRILELYLNYAQWGTNIFGIEAAARHYFNRSAHDVTLDQATRLAAVLAMPERISPHYVESSFLQKRLRVIANNLYRRGSIGDEGFYGIAGGDSLPPGQADSAGAADAMLDSARTDASGGGADSARASTAPDDTVELLSEQNLLLVE